jgi:hypothetical protein
MAEILSDAMKENQSRGHLIGGHSSSTRSKHSSGAL